MNIRKILTGAVALALIGSPSVAETGSGYYFDGNKVWEWCRNDNRAILSGYVAGVYDTVRSGDLFCVPDNATAGQISDVVCKWLRDNPAHRHHVGADVVALAFALEYPCRQNRWN